MNLELLNTFIVDNTTHNYAYYSKYSLGYQLTQNSTYTFGIYYIVSNTTISKSSPIINITYTTNISSFISTIGNGSLQSLPFNIRWANLGSRNGGDYTQVYDGFHAILDLNFY
jgi:hypothetical protein